MNRPEPPNKPYVTLVDDDLSLRCLLKLYLQDSYQVRDYPDVASALAALDSEPVDLVISDIHMPGIDGLAFRRHLAKQPHTDILPFIFITSSEEDSLLHQAENLGVDDYLIKPIRKRKLLTTIRRILQRNRRIQDRLVDLLDQRVKFALRPTLPPRLSRFRCTQAACSANTGGSDLLTYCSDTEGTTLILVDVHGQGLQTKFFAYVYAGYLSGLIRNLPTVTGPGEILLRLSAAIKADPVMQAVLVNCLIVRLCNNGHIRLASAGQPPPVLANAGSIHYVETGGLPPGRSNFGKYPEITLRIHPGQRLLLYTDGLLPEGNDQHARERFEQAVRESSILSTRRAIDHIMRVADPQGHDDATLILLEIDLS